MSTVSDQATDENLMARYQRGDRQAFTVLVRRHQSALYNFAVRQIGTPSTAEEVVQDAFVRVVQNAADFKHEARFTTWVYTIVRNLCIDHLRKRALRRHPSLDDSASGKKGGDGGEGPSLGERTADPRASVEREATGRELAVKFDEASPDCTLHADPYVVGPLLALLIASVHAGGGADVVVRARCTDSHATFTIEPVTPDDASFPTLAMRVLPAVPPTGGAARRVAEQIGATLELGDCRGSLTLPCPAG